MINIASLVVMVLLGLPDRFQDFSFFSSRYSPISKSGTFLFFIVAIASFFAFSLLSVNSDKSHADMKKMSEKELSEVTGKNLLDFTVESGQTDVTGSFDTGCGGWGSCDATYEYNIDNTDITFTRINLDARLEVDVGDNEDGVVIDDLKVGDYDDSLRIGDGNDGFITGGADGSVGQSFYYGPHFTSYNGCNGCGNNDGSNSFDIDTQEVVLAPGDKNYNAPVIKGAYVEMAYENFGNSNQKLAGVRVGAEKIKGGATIDSINQISSSVRAQEFNNLGSANCAGHRMDNCPTTLGTNALALFNALKLGRGGSDWGDDDGWTEDLWMSFNAQDMFWRHNNPEAGTNNASEARFHTDGEGFWLHATDDIEGGLS